MRLLSLPQVSGISKSRIEFDVKKKEIQLKFESFEMEDKLEGLELLIVMFGKCGSYPDQLKIFALKA